MKIARMIAIVAALAACVIVVAAQDRSQLRTVRGSVVDKEENPTPRAIVYLKNLQTLTIRTYIADGEGKYRFSGLDRNVDYEIHAEHQDSASSRRTVSSFDNRNEIVITLKLDRKRGDR
jgi:hypothetical protein